jgi:hypothetical protein
MRPRLGDVQDRRAVDIDPEGAKVVGHEAGAQPSGLAPGSRTSRKIGQDSRRRILPPVGRPEALHSAAFLVDQDRGVLTTHSLAQGGDETPHLVRSLDIAGEQNKPPGTDIPEEGDLLGA